MVAVALALGQKITVAIAGRSMDNQRMSNEHSISDWLQALRDGSDAEAAQEIWNRFQKRLIGVALKQLRFTAKRTADGEDVVNEAFASFYRRIENGEYPDVKDRDGLWRMLLTITENKARKQLRRELAAKRGAGKTRGDSIFRSSPNPADWAGFEQIASTDPTPDDVMMLRDTMSDLFDRLSDEERTIATLRMQSYSNAEVSQETDLSLATVERRLKKIREKWSELDPGGSSDGDDADE